jgi:UDP-N-acetylmuramoylalanine--D-glutamate ligase
MKVAIAGYGMEGEQNFRYWRAQTDDITICDENTPSRTIPENTKTIFGEGAFSQLQDFDLVVRTAGLRPDKIKTNGKIWSATNEFFNQCPVPIIGVTGTKGKGTTATLVSKILEEAGRKVWLLGNIGVPALEVLEEIQNYSGSDGVVVFELSSFQLWDLEKSPQTAVVLMIEPDHMDVHASMEEYIAAKANITAFQSEEDFLVYHPTNTYSRQIAEQSKALKVRFMTEEGANVVIPAQAGIQKSETVDPSFRWDDEVERIVIQEQLICAVEEVGLRGRHNLENICAAITASWNFTKDTSAIKEAVTQFKGLPHRLELVREFDGALYYNDSYSSAPGATIAAIKSFTNPEILICGGFDRGLDYTELAESVAERKILSRFFDR